MVLRKIVNLIICLFVMASCHPVNEPSDRTASGSFGNSLVKDQLLRQMTRDVFYQDSLIRVIHHELNKIDALYAAFESGIEHNRAQDNRADVIVTQIRHLERLLEETRSGLKTSKLENRGLLAMIDRFKEELATKEIKINILQNTVSQQAEEIAEKGYMIDKLEATRVRQRKEIERIEKELRGMKAAAYNDLADLLFQVAQEMPEVRGIFTRRTREEVEKMQENLIRDAHRYFEEAANHGDYYARSRANELKREYAFLP